jgi:hypothetical protein
MRIRRAASVFGQRLKLLLRTTPTEVATTNDTD